jgi:tetratricopeptide (TPR) repeat protein
LGVDVADKPLEDELLNLPEEDLEDIIKRVAEGAKNPKEALDFDDASMNAIEEVALGLYRSEMYDKASLVYGFALRLDPDRATCWRGLGACAQVSKAYEAAVLCYQAALERDPKDLISKACMGECFCLGGREVEGKGLLRSFVESAKNDPALKDFVVRARAILDD